MKNRTTFDWEIGKNISNHYKGKTIDRPISQAAPRRVDRSMDKAVQEKYKESSAERAPEYNVHDQSPCKAKQDFFKTTDRPLVRSETVPHLPPAPPSYNQTMKGKILLK